MNTFQDEDFCVYKSGGVVKSLGWNINSSLLQNDMPIAAYNQTGGGIHSAIQNLAIPAGLILLQNSIHSKTNPINNLLEAPQVIGEELYNKLLNLAGRKKRVSHDTRKKRKKRKNKTRKH
jgi:hypothetical protein